jgi:hypothetical protein
LGNEDFVFAGHGGVYEPHLEGDRKLQHLERRSLRGEAPNMFKLLASRLPLFRARHQPRRPCV